MPLARFYQLVRVASELKKEEEYGELEKRAWHAWQTNLPHWSKPVLFEKWKEIVGLAEVSTANEEQMSPKEAMDFAKQIMESDVKRKKHKE